MKNLLFIFFAALLASCASKQNMQIKELGNDSEGDSVSYELVVLDPGFETWYITRSQPTWYHSQEYYESWNQQYVNAWNFHYQGGRYARILENYIDYDPQVDYGLELNHKLFYYFQYVQHALKVPLLSNAPRMH